MAFSSNDDRQSEVQVVKLTGDDNSNNYSHWKSQMIKLIRSRDFDYIIDPSIPHPTLPPAGNVDGMLPKMWHKYLPLYRATIKHDWEKASIIFREDGNAIKAKISPNLDTILHVAVTLGKSKEAIDFLRNLVGLMSDNELLEVQDTSGYNPLHYAAATGNTKAARILVEKQPDLVYRASKDGRYPVHMAAIGHRDTLKYLINHTSADAMPNPYSGGSGVRLLITVITAGIFDVALTLTRKYPDLSRLRLSDGRSALYCIAFKDTAFHSGRRFTFLKSFLDYQFQKHKSFLKSHASLCKVLEKLVPCFVEIHRKQVLHKQALELVKCLCENLESLSWEEASGIYLDALFLAAELGIHEVVKAIVSTFPNSIHSYDSNKQNTFHLAVKYRNEKVFNLIHQPGYCKHVFVDLADSSGDTILHLVARLAPTHKLDLVSGAAIQMQREILWYKEVEKVVPLYARERKNYAGKTPKMVFIEEHTKLKAEGEKWMKDAANSCIITATLIATVVFASVITVPGGIESNHVLPVFHDHIAFKIFAFSDSASLCTSVTSIIMFLSIMTSRYAEEDFLRGLPKRLILGLISLFFSILFLIAAFCAALYLLFGKMRLVNLVAIPAFAFLPMTSFVILQFPLLVDLISSTYGRGIFS
ncbi:hypothetical protein ACJIZ3_006212 [Penstemon smallii]|uniref:PGG domain-containing protein n=1 Tax=Penstemon smallii TaxID=265156 RepID=A0ABD3S757_9LAMI